MSEEILNDELQETEETEKVKTYDFPDTTVFYRDLLVNGTQLLQM